MGDPDHHQIVENVDVEVEDVEIIGPPAHLVEILVRRRFAAVGESPLANSVTS